MAVSFFGISQFIRSHQRLGSWQDTPLCRDSLAVFLGQSQGEGGQELIQGAVCLGGQVVGEHLGNDHEDAVAEKLWVIEETHFSLANSW